MPALVHTLNNLELFRANLSVSISEPMQIYITHIMCNRSTVIFFKLYQYWNLVTVMWCDCHVIKFTAKVVPFLQRLYINTQILKWKEYKLHSKSDWNISIYRTDGLHKKCAETVSGINQFFNQFLFLQESIPT